MKSRLAIIATTTGLTSLGLAAAHPAAAQTSVTIYNFEVQGSDGAAVYDGTGALAGAGTTWNLADSSNHVYDSATGYSGNAVTNAVDSNGVASAVGFNVQSDETLTQSNDGVASNPDVLFSNYALDYHATPYEISFTGLAPDASFTVDLYAENGNDSNDTDGRGADFNLTDSTYTDVISTVDVQNSGTPDTAFTEATPGPYGAGGNSQNNSNYAQFSGTTDADGDVYFTYGDTQYSGGSAQFNAAQIEIFPAAASAAPEPSEYGVMALVTIGLGGLLLRGRKRAALCRQSETVVCR